MPAATRRRAQRTQLFDYGVQARFDAVEPFEFAHNAGEPGVFAVAHEERGDGGGEGGKRRYAEEHERDGDATACGSRRVEVAVAEGRHCRRGPSEGVAEGVDVGAVGVAFDEEDPGGAGHEDGEDGSKRALGALFGGDPADEGLVVADRGCEAGKAEERRRRNGRSRGRSTIATSNQFARR